MGMLRGAFLLAIIVIVPPGICLSTDSVCLADEAGSEEAIWTTLLAASRDARVEHEKAERKWREEVGAEFGPWRSIGPFKDAAFGIASVSFSTVFSPEKDVLNAGNSPVDFGKTYDQPKFPGYLDTKRVWQTRPEWTDGYRHLLPRGPAPSRNETVYLFRTLTTRKAAVVEVAYRSEDLVRIWVNGKIAGEASQITPQVRIPKTWRFKFDLKAGENRLLVKHTSIHNAHGFAMNIPRLTGLDAPDDKELQARFDSTENRLVAGHEPYASSRGLAGSRNDAETVLDSSKGTTVQLDAYTRAIAEWLEVPPGVMKRLPLSSDPAGLALARRICDRARIYRDALARVREFHFDVTPVPIFDPPVLKMHETLEHSHPRSPAAHAYLSRLANLKRQAAAAVAATNRAEPDGADAVIRVARAIGAMWDEQIRSLGPIVFIRRPASRFPAMAPYNVEDVVGSGGVFRASPSSICVFDPARPQAPARVIYDCPSGSIYDLSLSFDVKTIFFSAQIPGVEGGFQIYEVGVDGRGLKQRTVGPSSNVSPVLLPSGEVMFVSTRAGTYVQCQPHRAGLLYVMNRDGTKIRKVSANIDSDHSPQVLDDGRVLFTRWDYGIEKNVYSRQALWVMNPDGTRFELFFGNTIEDPCGFWTAMPIPGRPEVVCVFGPHHEGQHGSVGLVWNHFGKEAPRGTGFRWLSREMPAQGDLSYYHGWQRPFPVHESLFLASYGGDGERKNRLYLLDDRGNRKCVYEDAALGCWNPLLLRPRPAPPAIAPQAEPAEFVDRDPESANRNPDGSRTATLVVADVYQGIAAHVSRGEVKYIQVMEQVQKSRRRVGLWTAWGTVNPIISRGTVHVRRVIGRVPIESDGSAHFTVPALRNISLDVLDGDGKLLMRMGSDMHLMPGENRGCIGCHASRAVPWTPGDAQRSPLALRHAPVAPRQPDWGTDGIVDFPKVVQPVLDKYCVECHSGATPDGAIDLSGDKTRFFSVAYDNLIEHGLVDYFQSQAVDVDNTSPKNNGSLLSRLCEYIDTEEHCGQKIPPADRERIYCWIDANVPYYGTYASNPARWHTAGSRDCWDLDNSRGWFQTQVMPVFTRRCLGCHERSATIQDTTYCYSARVTNRLWAERGLTDHSAGQPLHHLMGPELRINLTHPEHSLLLTAPLALGSGGLGLCRDKNGTPFIFKDRDDPDYRALLAAIRQGNWELIANPRADMLPSHESLDLLTDNEIHNVKVHAVSSEMTGRAGDGKDRDRRAANLTIDSGLTYRYGYTFSEDWWVLTGLPDGAMWLTAGVGYPGFGQRDSRPFVVFDLGGVYDVGQIRIWNYNEVGHTAFGVKDLEVHVSTDGKIWHSGGVFSLPRECLQMLTMLNKADGVRYVKFDILSNHNGSDYQKGVIGADWGVVGLGKVRLLKTLTPAQRRLLMGADY